MLIKRLVVGMLSFGAMVLGAGVVLGQDYPNKPIRIVTSPAGGAGDFVARLTAQGLSGSLRQPVIVENRGGIVPAETVSKAAPDGYTLLLDGGSFWIGPLLQITPYDPVRDFSPISMLTSSPNVLVVSPTLPVNSVKELIALAKARPGELNYGSGETGSANHLAAELFLAMAGVNIVRIPYSGAGPAVTALIGGELQLTFGPAAAVSPHLKAGRLRALAITSAQPTALFPGVPTVAAILPGYEAVSILGIFAPAKTPETIINRLNQEVVRLLHTADVKERFLNAGVEIVGNSPAEAAARAKANMLKWGKLIKDLKISS